MSGLDLVLVAACLLAGSGVPGLFGSSRSRWGERTAVAAVTLAALVGLVGVLLPGPRAIETLQVAWGLPWGQFGVALDPIGRVFLLPSLLVPALGALYGLGYWRQVDHPENGRKLRLFYGLMPAAMTIVLVARDAALFLLAWEVMALSAFFLVTTEDSDDAARGAGWVYLVATHVGTLALVAMFALLRRATGSLALGPMDATQVGPAVSNAIFVLAVLGFGLKAGLMPLHLWLPGAHANAPSHVSALLSGVMLKMGVYGLVRLTSLLPLPPVWWSSTLLIGGAVSAVVGLVFALGQHDIKRLLAYSSIENIGIITLGLGSALLGRARGEPAWIALGLAGALLHLWNHSLFKPLLFFGAGAILHGAGTRRMDLLGGLAKRMPRTAFLFLVGSVAVSALPPLNGFVSEWLIVLGLFHALGSSGQVPWSAAVVVPALALAGGLAVAVFVRLFGTVFLGQPRTEGASHAHDAPWTLLAPMIALAVFCLTLGIAPIVATPLLDEAIAAWCSGTGIVPPSIAAVASLRWFPVTALVLIGLSLTGFSLLRRTSQATPRPGTWDCGYARPGARMQYTGSSFAQPLVGVLSWALWPRARRTKLPVPFPEAARFETEVPDPVLDLVIQPFVRVTANFLRWVRVLHQGQIQAYLFVILLTVLVLFISMYLG
jgi:hydrogenase-4 component B